MTATTRGQQSPPRKHHSHSERRIAIISTRRRACRSGIYCWKIYHISQDARVLEQTHNRTHAMVNYSTVLCCGMKQLRQIKGGANFPLLGYWLCGGCRRYFRNQYLVKVGIRFFHVEEFCASTLACSLCTHLRIATANPTPINTNTPPCPKP